MNKNELVEAVAGRVGDRPTAAVAVDAVLTAVMRTVLAGERVALSGFGVFEKADRPARTARNPATGATLELPPTSVPRFRAGQAFKEVISGARELPPDGEAAVLRARPRTASVPSAAAALTEQPTVPAAAQTPPTAVPAQAAATPAPAKAAATQPAPARRPTTAKQNRPTKEPAKGKDVRGKADKATDVKGRADKAKAGKGKDAKGKDAKGKDAKGKDAKKARKK